MPLPGDTSAMVDAASAEIARFDADATIRRAPFPAVLLRAEAACSSSMAGRSAEARAVALAEIGATTQADAVSVVATMAATYAALLAERFDAATIAAVQAPLRGRVVGGSAGSRGTEQVRIGGRAAGSDADPVTPPDPQRVSGPMDDLVKFFARADVPVLARAAVAHAQLVAIQPFGEGNGRTARALLHAVLRGQGLVRSTIVPVSAGLLADTAGYFRSLDAHRAGDPAPIVQTLAQASLDAIARGRSLAGTVRSIRAEWGEQVRARRGATVWRLADLLLRQPVIDAATVAAELDIAPQNAQRAIAPLADAGVLIELTGFRRNRLWQAAEILAVLDDVAAGVTAGDRWRAPN